MQKAHRTIPPQTIVRYKGGSAGLAAAFEEQQARSSQPLERTCFLPRSTTNTALDAMLVPIIGIKVHMNEEDLEPLQGAAICDSMKVRTASVESALLRWMLAPICLMASLPLQDTICSCAISQTSKGRSTVAMHRAARFSTSAPAGTAPLIQFAHHQVHRGCC